MQIINPQADTLLNPLYRRYHQALTRPFSLARRAAIANRLHIPDKALALSAARSQVKRAVDAVDDLFGVAARMEPGLLVAHRYLGPGSSSRLDRGLKSVSVLLIPPCSRYASGENQTRPRTSRAFEPAASVMTLVQPAQ